MAMIFLSEYTSERRDKTAQVFKYSNGEGYVVRLNDQEGPKFDSEEAAENFCEDWVSIDTDE